MTGSFSHMLLMRAYTPSQSTWKEVDYYGPTCLGDLGVTTHTASTIHQVLKPQSVFVAKRCDASPMKD
ncbi:hypothetical protein EGR_03643 [Echinococcus granulosus]|uniref:Uncharacterized protein n=1 Tax=Echinococcus granulosus TaxID=6210 RepID=W6V5J7_ECHGR|nr:hypothetical protein EGR_03643 [Echinococcus granulosus]EUB61579.1 hypothetical protein EGR_03643 [Echinococcus granulosus]